jgi:hypothetical protein
LRGFPTVPLEQFEKNHETRHVLFPNQQVGAWKAGFMPQWIIREYLARRGNKPFDGQKQYLPK